MKVWEAIISHNICRSINTIRCLWSFSDIITMTPTNIYELVFVIRRCVRERRKCDITLICHLWILFRFRCSLNSVFLFFFQFKKLCRQCYWQIISIWSKVYVERFSTDQVRRFWIGRFKLISFKCHTVKPALIIHCIKQPPASYNQFFPTTWNCIALHLN